MKGLYERLTPPQVLLAVFIVTTLLGTILLKLPVAVTEEISWLDALFTTVSAMTVTGLVVVDTGTVYTVFGQTVIMVLIQVGGLGIMTFAVLVFLLLGRKVRFRQRLWVQQALNQSTQGGVIKLVKRILFYSFLIEAVAFICLSGRWVPELGWSHGLYASLFHTVSAFNNAGFSIWSDSLMQYAGDPTVNIVITFLFIVGGLGFTVIADLWETKTFRGLTLHTKIMLVGTVSVNIIAFLVVFFVEYANPNTMGSMSFFEKIFASYFQAVTTRTAGFNTVDIGALDEATLSFFLLLMFIGAGSTSTGGGIKLTTFLAIASTVVMFVRSRGEVVIFRRTLASAVIIRSVAITMIAGLLIVVAVFILEVTEEASFLMVLFEVVSAFGTVGLSMGLTPELSGIGKIVIILIMFVGKVGPLTLAFSIAKQEVANIRYPSEEILTG
ncbi:TrkH family potassium uptake protein [Bacillus tianshenii]|nr:TrkH family potassium uptake protein [Bacillus tianshenii]